MKRIVLIILLVVMGAGCGPTIQEQRAARMRALQMDLDGTYGRWEADVARQRFTMNADAVRDLEARYAAVYARWSVQVDPFSQAILSYTVAVARKVDQREISREDATRLFEKMKADMDHERRTFASPPEASQAQRSALMLHRWEAYWNQHQHTYQTSARTPVTCRAIPDANEGGSVRCD